MLSAEDISTHYKQLLWQTMKELYRCYLRKELTSTFRVENMALHFRLLHTGAEKICFINYSRKCQC